MPCSSLPENHSDTDATNEIAAPRKSRALARPSRAATRAESNVRFCVVSISYHLCPMFVQTLYGVHRPCVKFCPRVDGCDMYKPSTRRHHMRLRGKTLLKLGWRSGRRSARAGALAALINRAKDSEPGTPGAAEQGVCRAS